MKKISTILGLLMLVAVAFSSCGSDDDTTEHSLNNAICRHTHDLGIANASAEITSPETKASLDDMLKQYDYVSPIIGGVMNLTSETSIEIKGLKEGVVLENFTLTMNGQSQNFGTINNSTTQLYNDTNLEFFKNAFNRMVQQRNLTVYAKYKPSVKISDEDNLRVEIVFKGNFTYRK